MTSHLTPLDIYHMNNITESQQVCERARDRAELHHSVGQHTDSNILCFAERWETKQNGIRFKIHKAKYMHTI
jgi:hypothetical protein